MAFEQFRQDMFRRLSPAGAVEVQLIEKAAWLMWRLRRFPAFETALFEARKQKVIEARLNIQRLPGRSGNDDRRDGEVATMGRVVELLLDQDLLSKLGRYESGLQKQLDVTLKEIREMQASRANVRVGEENNQR